MRRMTVLYNTKNGCVHVNGDIMDYIAFGKGERVMILLPGIGDGLKTARGMAIPFALMYRQFAKDFRVFVFSRRRCLPQKYTTRDMACDQIAAMKALGIEQADVVGVSMGGMIAQWMAIDSPEKVGKLVLVVTASRLNETLKESLDAWRRCAEQGNYVELMLDSAKRMYTDAYLRKNKWMISMMTRIGRPKSFQRFLIMCHACMEHQTYERLSQIHTPTLVIAGAKDRALGVEASKEMAQNIPQCRLQIYENYGHAVYEEAKGFNLELRDCLTTKNWNENK